MSGKILCYYGSWATYRQNEGKVSVSDLNGQLCTHIIYSFAGIDEQGNVVLLDPWLDKKALVEVQRLKKSNPQLKLMIAIGGWNQGSIRFSRVAANPGLRETFANNVVKFLIEYNLDGIDLDWEYPGQRGGTQEDKANLIELLRELRTKLTSKYVLSAAVGANSELLGSSYDAKKMVKYLDYINLMTYDFHSSADGVAGFNAPLSNTRNSVESWLAAGAPPEKLILGLGFYGKSYTLANASDNHPGAKTIGPGNSGEYTKQAGILSYMEISLKIKNNNWTRMWDSKEQVPYAFSGNQWVGYDDSKSLIAKVDYAKSKKLGGVMMWSIDQDDVHNACGTGKYPLLTTLHNRLKVCM